MRVKRMPDTQSVAVELRLENAVALSDADLWRLAGGDDQQVPLAAKGDSTTQWAGIPAPDGQSQHLTVYWTAYEPMHDKWVYTARITVVDQDGRALPGAGGHRNPTYVRGKIGEEQPSYGRGSHDIVVER